MKKKLILFFVITFVCLEGLSVSHAQNTISSDVNNAYTKFYREVSSIAPKDENKLLILKELSDILNFSNKEIITQNNYQFYDDLQIVNNEKIFELEFAIAQKAGKNAITNNSALDFYNKKAFNDETIFLQNGVWYFYDFRHYIHFNDTSITQTELKYNGLLDKNVLVYYEGKKVAFVKDYNVRKIISDDIIYGFPNKYDLLKTLKTNVINEPNKDYDKQMRELKSFTKTLLNNIYDADTKIKLIYSYILKNVEYDLNSTPSIPGNYSGIGTYLAKKGVCEGYVELFNLMLGFVNISSVIHYGDVIDVDDFPEIAHAWVSVGEYYYDPTFDDPINYRNLDFDEYRFFKIPKDLFYTDRYELQDTPEYLKTTTLEFRENMVNKNRYDIYSKYKNSNYKILKGTEFRIKNSLAYNAKIDLNTLLKILDVYEFDGRYLTYKGVDVHMKAFKYSEIKEDSLEYLLSLNNYDTSKLILVKFSNGQYYLSNKSEIEYF